MLIKSDFEVAEPVDKVWQFFENIPQVATCLPGAELTEDLGGEKYKGRVAVRMGPVRLQFAGTADIVERDDNRNLVHTRTAETQARRRVKQPDSFTEQLFYSVVTSSRGYSPTVQAQV